jgi:hypothetical protein
LERADCIFRLVAGDADAIAELAQPPQARRRVG